MLNKTDITNEIHLEEYNDVCFAIRILNSNSNSHFDD